MHLPATQDRPIGPGVRPFLPVIKQRCNAVINLTSGGSPTMRVEAREAAEVFKPGRELNMGSMNFALFPMLNPTRFKLDWEELTKAPATSFPTPSATSNSCSDLPEQRHPVRFECYDIAHPTIWRIF